MIQGFVYYVQADGGGPVKIGFATDPRARLEILQVGSPYSLQILAASPGTLDDERSMHAELRAYWIRGEWFHSCAEVEGRRRRMVAALGSRWDRKIVITARLSPREMEFRMRQIRLINAYESAEKMAPVCRPETRSA